MVGHDLAGEVVDALQIESAGARCDLCTSGSGIGRCSSGAVALEHGCEGLQGCPLGAALHEFIGGDGRGRELLRSYARIDRPSERKELQPERADLQSATWAQEQQVARITSQASRHVDERIVIDGREAEVIGGLPTVPDLLRDRARVEGLTALLVLEEAALLEFGPQLANRLCMSADAKQAEDWNPASLLTEGDVPEAEWQTGLAGSHLLADQLVRDRGVVR